MKILGYIAMILLIIGALNWGLIGFFDYNAIETWFGGMSTVSRVIYALVGLSGVYKVIRWVTCCGSCKKK